MASEPQIFLVLAVSFIYAISIHEASHAFVADILGDKTARYQGRVTLNPIRHLDLYGSLMLIVLGFGWGKPVPINPINLRGDTRQSMAKIAVAGPAANLLSAVVFGLLLRALIADGSEINLAHRLLEALTLINLVLAIFNLLPIPPLDGFTLLLTFTNSDNAQRLRYYSRQIMMTFFGIIVLGYVLQQNILESLIAPPTGFIFRKLLGV